MGAATRVESVTCPNLACVHKNLINPIMCCRCRHISRELTILRARYVENAFDQGFMKEAVALMILLTFPGDCKDWSGNNQISMSFLSFGWEAYGGALPKVGDEETLRLRVLIIVVVVFNESKTFIRWGNNSQLMCHPSGWTPARMNRNQEWWIDWT